LEERGANGAMLSSADVGCTYDVYEVNTNE
jgi:hypothetical protein